MTKKLMILTLIIQTTLLSFGQKTNNMNIENTKLYQENINYPYTASEKRKAEVFENMHLLKKGMTKGQVIELMTCPDEVNLTYKIKKSKSENNLIGSSMVYLFERKQELGSVIEKEEKLIRIHFNNSSVLIWAYSVDIDMFNDIEQD